MSKERFFRFIAIILVIFTFIFIGWALWTHFFGNNTKPQNNQSTSDIKIEDEDKSSQKSENSSSQNSGKKSEEAKSESTNNSADTKNGEKSQTESGVNSANSSAINQSQSTGDINQTAPAPAELPKTGVDFEF